jgi:probable rRNA maturation factor
MKHEVAIRSDPRWQSLAPALKSAALQTLQHLSADDGMLTVVLTTRETMRDLNRTFAGEDHATDVLSFSDGSIDPETGLHYFGDVIIAVEIARQQAEAAGRSLMSELVLLAVHGVLHLMGYDHAGAGEKRQMWSQQSAIIAALEISHPQDQDP